MTQSSFDSLMPVSLSTFFLIPLKILSFSKYTLNDGTAGQAINLMSNDVSRFDWLMCFTDDFWKAPLTSAVAAYFIFTQVGYSGLVGMAILLLFMPFQGKTCKANKLLSKLKYLSMVQQHGLVRSRRIFD